MAYSEDEGTSSTKQEFFVDDDIEDAGLPGDQREFINEILIVVNEIVGRAHGAV